MTPQTPNETATETGPLKVGDRVRRGKRGKKGTVFSAGYLHIFHVDVLFDGEAQCKFTHIDSLTRID